MYVLQRLVQLDYTLQYTAIVCFTYTLQYTAMHQHQCIQCLHSNTCDAGDACQGAGYTAFHLCKPMCYLGKEYPLAASEAGASIEALLSGHGGVRLFS